MEEILKIPAFQQVPGLIVMGFIVLAFLKYLANRDQIFKESQQDTQKALEITASSIEKKLDQAAQATRENADATRANTRAVESLQVSINHSTAKHH